LTSPFDGGISLCFGFNDGNRAVLCDGNI